MAETQRELGTEETGNKTKSEISSEAKSKATSGTVKTKRKRASRKKAARVDGAERLRRAADRQVGKNSKNLAELLTEKALGGDLASAKMLVGLADGKKPEQISEEESGPSYAELLAADPPWPGETKDRPEAWNRGWGPATRE